MDGWIYILQERAHLNTNTYKLGRTGNISDRLKSRDYRCCKIISICYCPGVTNIDNHNPSYKEAEDVIKKEFKLHFGNPVEGSETFCGDVNKMIEIVETECKNIRTEWNKYKNFFDKFFNSGQKMSAPTSVVAQPVGNEICNVGFLVDSHGPAVHLQKIKELEGKLELQKKRQKIACNKYHKTAKGKAARKRSYKKCYKPTGNPRGRPKKISPPRNTLTKTIHSGDITRNWFDSVLERCVGGRICLKTLPRRSDRQLSK